MGSYLSSATTGPRQPRRLATAAIGVVAVIGLVTACTASSVGAAKRAPERYPDRYPAGATGQVTTTPLADTPESIRLEKAARRAISMTVTRPGALSETELMRQEHQPGHFEK